MIENAKVACINISISSISPTNKSLKFKYTSTINPLMPCLEIIILFRNLKLTQIYSLTN